MTGYQSYGNLIWQNKTELLPSCGCVSTTVWMHHLDTNKMHDKKLDGNYTRILHAVLTKSWKQLLTKHWLYSHLPSHRPFKLDRQDMLGTVGGIRKKSEVMFSSRFLHMGLAVLAIQQGLYRHLMHSRWFGKNDGWEQILRENRETLCYQHNLMMMYGFKYSYLILIIWTKSYGFNLIILLIISKVSKIGNCSRGQPDGSLFISYYTKV